MKTVLPWLLILSCLATIPTGCRNTPPLQAPTTSRPSTLERHVFEQVQMGLPFRMVLYAESREKARQAAEAAYARIAELNAVLSDYEDNSELTLLSKSSGSNRDVPVGPDLWAVLTRAQQISRATDGAFDISVGPFVQLWKRARRERQLPPPDKLAEAASRVGYNKIALNHKKKTARLTVAGMRLDPGAIAKGYATDEALKVLRRHGVRSALVAGGGDMSAGDPPPGQPGWRVSLSPLDVTNAPPSRFVWIRNQGLATSGDVFQRFEFGGVRYSHIVDPRTGVGLTDHSLVTVIASDGMTADALSTSVSVLGPERGMKLVESTSNAAGTVVRLVDGKLEAFDSTRLSRFLAKPAAPVSDPSAGSKRTK